MQEEQKCSSCFYVDSKITVKKKHLTPYPRYSKILSVGNEKTDRGLSMERIVERGLLYDFYGELLTKHQRQIYENIVNDDLSLGEIAEELGVSRQSVHDIVKRCDKTLHEYEEKLRPIARFQSIKAKIEKINRLSQEYEQGGQQEKSSYSVRIKELSDEILQEL